MLIDFSGVFDPQGETMIGTYQSGTGHFWLVRQQDPAVEVTIGDVAMYEPDPGNAATVRIPISLSDRSSQAVTVTYRIDPGSSSSQDIDCRKCGIAQTMSFALLANGTTGLSKDVAIRLWGDSMPESDEQFTVTILSVSGALGTTDSIGTGTINDND